MKNDISLITPVSKDLIYMKIADAITSYIQANDLQYGDKLPPERELASRFQTSRHSVREALKVLENQGILFSKVGSGTYVAHNHRHTSIYMEFVKINYIELLNIKTELEKYAAVLAMHNISISQLEQLNRILCRLEEQMEKNIFDSDTDKKFHDTLTRLSGNHMLHQMIWKMIEVFDEYYGIIPQSKQLALETIPLHRTILNGIREKNESIINTAYDRILEIDRKLVEIEAQDKPQQYIEFEDV